MARAILIGGLLAVMAIPVHQAAAATKLSPDGKKINSYLTSLADESRFSGAVLVAQKGRVLLSKGYGMADQADNRLNSSTTKYPVGGVTTATTLVVGLKLEEQGTLHDADLVCSYLSSCPDSWKAMTVGMVLDGTAGMPDAGWEFAGTTVTDTLATCQSQALIAPLGTGLHYGNCTVVVLGLAAEKATGKTWAELLSSLIFTPAGMKNSGLMTDDLVPPARAEDYSGGNPDPSTRYNTYFALYATVRDVYAFDQALFSGKILSKASLARLMAARAAFQPPDINIGNGHWATGWKMGTAFGHHVIYTLNDIHSFSAINMRFPKDGLTIIVISNDDQNDVEGAGIHASAAVFGAKVPAAPTGPVGPPPAVVDPSRAIQATVNVDAGCTTEPFCNPSVPVAATGVIWAAFAGTGRVVRIDTTTNTASAITVVQQAYDPNAETDTGSVALWNGQVWTTDLHDNAIARVDPATDRVVEIVAVGTTADFLAPSADSLWIAGNQFSPNPPLIRFDATTRKAVATIPNLGLIEGLLATPDAVWASLRDTAEVVRIDPATNQVAARFKAGTNPQSLALGDGSLWVANGIGHYLTRMDPATGKIQAIIQLDQHGDARDPGYGCGCQSVTIDANGVWAVAHDTHSLVRIDPQTNRITSSLTLPKAADGTPMQPWDVLSAEGSLWVTVTPHAMLRIDPKPMLASSP
jgi:CubicO group peptidase (beta-lactamase class C family)/streptogramin lyase